MKCRLLPVDYGCWVKGLIHVWKQSTVWWVDSLYHIWPLFGGQILDIYGIPILSTKWKSFLGGSFWKTLSEERVHHIFHLVKYTDMSTSIDKICVQSTCFSSFVKCKSGLIPLLHIFTDAFTKPIKDHLPLHFFEILVKITIVVKNLGFTMPFCFNYDTWFSRK